MSRERYENLTVEPYPNKSNPLRWMVMQHSVVRGEFPDKEDAELFIALTQSLSQRGEGEEATEASCDDGEFVSCESCGDDRVPHDKAVYSEASYFCPNCYAEWKAEFDACEHSTVPHWDEYGDECELCTKCSGIVRYQKEELPASDVVTDPTRAALEECVRALQRLLEDADEECGEKACPDCAPWRVYRSALTQAQSVLGKQENT